MPGFCPDAGKPSTCPICRLAGSRLNLGEKQGGCCLCHCATPDFSSLALAKTNHFKLLNIRPISPGSLFFMSHAEFPPFFSFPFWSLCDFARSWAAFRSASALRAASWFFWSDGLPDILSAVVCVMRRRWIVAVLLRAIVSAPGHVIVLYEMIREDVGCSRSRFPEFI